MKTEIVRMAGISKSIEGDEALNNINLNLLDGEILGVLGLNGSGKSTLVKLLIGGMVPDSGIIYVDDEPVEIRTPSDAYKIGFHCISQNTKLVPGFSIAENIFVIRKNSPWKVFLNQNEIHQKTLELLADADLPLTPDTIAGTLSTIEIHLVEIVKAVNEGARVIIMDDVTDDYSPRDLETLKKMLHNYCHRGIAFLFASRMLDSILEISDRITVLREGTTVRTLHREEFSKQILVKSLTGRNFEDSYAKSGSVAGEEVLQIDLFSTSALIRDSSIILHRGEILSLMDIEGTFSDELVHVLFGKCKTSSYSIWIEGKKSSIKNYRDAVKQGIGLIPETWYNSLFENLDLADNLVFLVYKRISKGLTIINSRIAKLAVNVFDQIFGYDKKIYKKFNINDLNQIERIKIIMFRWFLRKPLVLLMVKPSLHIDLVARQSLYGFMEKIAKEGVAILLIATDLSEAAAISDRVIVINNGKMINEYSYQEAQNLSVDDVS